MSAWNPYLIKDKEALELVQRRASKKAPNLRNFSNQERLEKLNLTSLEERRVIGDLIQQYKIVNGFGIVRWNNQDKLMLFENHAIPRPVTRGHRFKIIKENTKDNIRFNFFINRIANDWNALSSEVVEAKSINCFKAKLDKLYELNGTYRTKKMKR